MKLKFFNLLFIFMIMAIFLQEAFAKKPSLVVQVKTVNDLPIKKQLLEQANDIMKTARIYSTTNQKSYWEIEGKRLFHKLLKFHGYYDSLIDVEVPNDSNIIIFHIDGRQRYTNGDITLKYETNSNESISIPDISDLTIKTGQFTVVEDVINAQNQLLDYIESNNCLLFLDVSHAATVNHLEKKIDIEFIVNAGPTATIENIEFRGVREVNPEYLHKLINLKKGQCYKTRYVKEARSSLQKSGLFISTNPIIPKTTNNGAAPVIFELTERKPRSLKAGISYGTDLGLGGTLGWEHRNFFGNGEKVDANLFANKKEQMINIEYVKPFYKRNDQTLRAGLGIDNKKSKAYDSQEIAVSTSVEREFSSKWIGGFGLGFSQSIIKKTSEYTEQHFTLLSTPMFLTHDTRNNLLEPRKGNVITLDASPFFTVNNKSEPFFKAKISGVTYFSVPVKFAPVLALRAATGCILAKKTNNVPHPERFYVGGSNSLRGYAYQLAGDLDKNERPIGGSSIVETTVELRLDINEDIGIVGFLDSGYAYDKALPRYNKFFRGAGVGFRYFTDFGPIRVDVGFPLKRRKFIDNAYQLYLGIGQTF